MFAGGRKKKVRKSASSTRLRLFLVKETSDNTCYYVTWSIIRCGGLDTQCAAWKTYHFLTFCHCFCPKNASFDSISDHMEPYRMFNTQLTKLSPCVFFYFRTKSILWVMRRLGIEFTIRLTLGFPYPCQEAQLRCMAFVFIQPTCANAQLAFCLSVCLSVCLHNSGVHICRWAHINVKLLHVWSIMSQGVPFRKKLFV